MPKRLAIEYDEESEFDIKDESTHSPPPVTPSKKSRKSSSSTTPISTSSSSPTKTPSVKAKGTLGSSATSKKGMYMEMIFEAGVKAINKKAVHDEVGLSPAQQAELIRKDKGALRRAVSGFIAGL